MNKVEKDTRDKILDIAQKLFAQKGFDGTSVRDIAKEAEVNIAAINYHFKNKAALYWQVTMLSHQRLEEGIAGIAKENLTVAELSWNFFEYLIKHNDWFKNAFMMFLSDSTPDIEPEIAVEMQKEKNEFGPPGGRHLMAAINRELGESFPLEARQWAVKSIFSIVAHWALVMGSSHCQEIYEDHPDFQIENKKKFIFNHVKATLEYLKNHGENWD